MDKLTLAVAKKYTDETVVGGGAIKGKNCIVESIEKIEGYTRVHFKWTLDDGTVQRQYTDLPDGQKGDPGDKGDTGVGLPEGGTVGQVLVKKSSADYDMEWGTPGGGGDMLKSVYDTDNDGKVNSAENADTVGGHTVVKDVPADAKFTDTVYDDTEIREEIADKVDKVSGKGLSTEDYTSEEKTKLAGVEASAEVNTIESITLNGTEVTPDANKNVALTVITNTVNNLVNYYLKSETYTKTEVDDIVTAIKNSRFEVVATLPTTDIKTNVIYLVPKSPPQTSNAKDEYINLDGTTAGWEKIGDTEVDLSGYVTTQALNTALANYTTTADLTTLLAGKQDTLTFDDAPTENSDNPVKSGGVYSANQNIYEVMGQMGAKNLITYPHSGKTETKAGITFTENADGSVTVNGTATEIVRHLVSSQQFEVGKKYILSGCPSGGSHSLNGTYTLYTQTVQNYDDGEGVEFTWDASITGITIAVFAGITVDNLTFYPMIRLASDTDSTYQSYAKTNKELTDDAEALAAKVNSLKEHTGTYLAEVGTKEGSALAKIIYGMSVQDGTPTPDSPVEIQSAKADFKCVGKNLIPYPYYDVNSFTSNGITYTVNSDGSITANGTATANSYYNLILFDTNKVLKGNYILSKGNYDTTSIRLNLQIDSTTGLLYQSIDSAKSISLVDKHIFKIFVSVTSGATVNNVTIKPMLTLADADQTYEPYQHTDVTTDITLRALEVPQNSGYNLVKDGKYYVADTVDWSEDKGYVITRRIKVEDLDDKTYSYDPYPSGGGYFYTTFNGILSRNYLDKVAICDGFAYYSLPMVNIPSGGFRLRESGSNILNFKYTLTSDVNEFKALVAGMKVYYILATPTTEPITSEQAQALLSLKTYDEASYISSTGSVEPSVDLEYATSEISAKALTGHNEAYIAQELEGVYGVKNFLDLSLSLRRSDLPAGITTTLTEDGGIHISGQRTDSGTSDWGLNYTIKGLKKGIAYKFTCNQYDVPRVGMYYVSSNITKPTTFTWTQDGDGTFTIYIAKGVTYDATIYPMLRLASIQSDEYQPYAMSNYELTKKIKELETALIELSSQ